MVRFTLLFLKFSNKKHDFFPSTWVWVAPPNGQKRKEYSFNRRTIQEGQ